MSNKVQKDDLAPATLPEKTAVEAPRPEPAPKSLKTPKTAPESFFVYLGPSIRGSVQKGAILPGSREAVEKQLESTIARYPLVKNLLIPGSAIAEDRAKVKKPGELLNRFYTKLAQQLTGG